MVLHQTERPGQKLIRLGDAANAEKWRIWFRDKNGAEWVDYVTGSHAEARAEAIMRGRGARFVIEEER